MTGDDSQFEANQILNAKGRIAPLRDTFFLVMSGDEISADVMGDFIDTCFNPVNLQFFIHKTMVEDGYEVLNEDYTRCYYEDKMANHLGRFSNKTRNSPEILGCIKLSNDGLTINELH